VSAAEYALGIDLGSTTTAAATWRDGRLDVVSLSEHTHAMPSVVYLGEDGTLLAGTPAWRRMVTDPTRVASDFKRDLASPVPRLLGGTAIDSTRLFATLIRHVLDVVTEREGGPPAHVTLTFPASWRQRHSGSSELDPRRVRLRAAAAQAGLPDAGLLEEPVAAATHYASLSRHRLPSGTLLAVYDLGGATFDVAVCRKTQDAFELLGHGGGQDVGGADFDDLVLAHVRSAIGASWLAGTDDDSALAEMAQLRADAKDRKEALSSDLEVTIPVLLPGTRRQVRLTRGEFEDAILDLVDQTVGIFGDVVHRSGVDVAQLDRVLLVGGASRIPLVTQRLTGALPGVATYLDEHPKWPICLGAAIAAGARLRPPPSAPPPTVAPPIVAPPLPALPVAAAGRDAVGATPESYDVDLAATALTGLLDVPLRPAVDLRPRRAPKPTPQIAAELGPAEVQDEPWKRYVAPGVALALVIAVLVLVLLISVR
jgi:molecular chaperone DnaK